MEPDTGTDSAPVRLAQGADPISVELDEAERQALAATLERHDPQGTLRVYLHAYGGSALEERLVRAAEIVYCGNSEIGACVSGLNSRVHTLWAPGLILDTRSFSPAVHSIFS